jgi:hypothetical protein
LRFFFSCRGDCIRSRRARPVRLRLHFNSCAVLPDFAQFAAGELGDELLEEWFMSNRNAKVSVRPGRE